MINYLIKILIFIYTSIYRLETVDFLLKFLKSPKYYFQIKEFVVLINKNLTHLFLNLIFYCNCIFTFYLKQTRKQFVKEK
jgi:hypothetical protein